MDADRIVAAGAAALDGPEAPAALGWLGRGPDDPVSLRRAWRTHRQSGKARDKRINHWLRGPDTFCRNRFCSQKRHQPATLIGDWLLWGLAPFSSCSRTAHDASEKGACPLPPVPACEADKGLAPFSSRSRTPHDASEKGACPLACFGDRHLFSLSIAGCS